MNRSRLKIVRNMCLSAAAVFAIVGVVLPFVMGSGSFSARATAVSKLMLLGGFDASLMKESTRISFMVGGSCLGFALMALQAGIVATFVLWLSSPDPPKEGLRG